MPGVLLCYEKWLCGIPFLVQVGSVLLRTNCVGNYIVLSLDTSDSITGVVCLK